jgi:hypothetical protein
MPRFIIFVRATSDIESEPKPNPELLQAMSDYNATMVEAGVLHSVVSRQQADRLPRLLQSGPFPANELVSGLWIVKVKDLDEAVAWAVKCPFKEGNSTEIRRIAEAEDFGDAMSPELRKREDELRVQVEKIAKGG